MLQFKLLAAILICQVQSLERPGVFNQFALIPFFEGSRVRDWDSKRVILQSDPSMFYWSYNWNVDSGNNLWVADSKRHLIYYVSKQVETWNAIFIVSG